MTLLGGSFVFESEAVAALVGADFGASLDEARVEMRSSFEIRAGQRLRLGATRSSARCYLSVQGGIAVPSFLGSASTHVMSGLGGFEGRALRKGDVLRLGFSAGSFRRRRIADHVCERLSRRGVLRVTRGPQADWFSERAVRDFYSQTYRVGEQSDRMGLRLEGATALEAPARPMITEGVSLGAIQVPPGGSPIILFVEQQTTGGYAKIANVISADLHRVGQLRPRDEIRFEQVTFETARALWIEQEELIASEAAILE
jgi:antagonist of KipI